MSIGFFLPDFPNPHCRLTRPQTQSGDPPQPMTMNDSPYSIASSPALFTTHVIHEKLKSQYCNVEGLPADRIVPTVGLNIGRIELSNIKLVFWDLGGQPGLRSIWEKYYEAADAVIYVVDAVSPSRFEDSKSALGSSA